MVNCFLYVFYILFAIIMIGNAIESSILFYNIFISDLVQDIRLYRKYKKGFMSEWKLYRRKGLSEMRPYVNGDDISGVSISELDRKAGSPKEGDMIARDPENHADQWLVAKKYFEDNLEPL